MRAPAKSAWMLALLASAPAQAALVVVNSAADGSDGTCNLAHCTLREAIEAANAAQDFDTIIDFAIPGGGTQTIMLLSPLPVLTHSAQLRGFTQPGAVAPTNATFNHTIRVQIDGSLLPDAGSVVGLHFNGPGQFETLEIDGIAFGGFARAQGDGVAVRVQAGRANIDSSHFGLAADGTTTMANDIGLLIESGRSVNIGLNLISGNRVGLLAHGARVAGQTPLRVTANRIGTDKAGTAARPNTEDGVRIVSRCASPAVTFEFTGNVVSGNTRDGIHLTGEAAGCNLLGSGALIVGNRIGTTASGAAALGNGRHGVFAGLLAVSDSIMIGSPAGSSFPENRNTIGFNGDAGVAVPSGAGGVLVRENTFRSNTGLPIDLGADGPTPNDAGDADTGANRLLNAPTLGALRQTANGLEIAFRSDSAAGTANYPMRIDFYSRNGGVLTFLQTDFLEAPNVARNAVIANLGNAELVAMLSDNLQGEAGAMANNSSEFSGPAIRSIFGNGFE